MPSRRPPVQSHRPRLIGVVAVVAWTMSAAVLSPGPAHAAPLDHVAARTVVFVHGYTPGGLLTSDCRHDFAGLAQVFDNRPGLYDSIQYWGYYPDDKSCTANFGSMTGRNTSIRWLGVLFAASFHDHFATVANRAKVDIVAHSMGGLIVRSAMTYDPQAFQAPDGSYLVEDIVEGGTGHGGGLYPCSGTCNQQTMDMAAGSPFLNDLNCRPSPGGSCGPHLPSWTDWTDMGSTYTNSGGSDGAVALRSALHPIGDHEVALRGVGHAQYFGTPLTTPDYYAINAAFNALTGSDR